MNDADRYSFLRTLALIGRELEAFVAVKRLDQLERFDQFDEVVDLAALRKGEFQHGHPAPGAARVQSASPSPLLAKQRISVAAHGELVVLTIGSTVIKLPYETALQVSQWLRLTAKQAKRVAGDTSRHWSALGVLEDLKR